MTLPLHSDLDLASEDEESFGVTEGDSPAWALPSSSVLHHIAPSLLCQLPGCDCMASFNSPLPSPHQPPVHAIDPSVLSIHPQMSPLNFQLLGTTANASAAGGRARQHVRTRREPVEDSDALVADQELLVSSSSPSSSTAGCDQVKKSSAVRRSKSIPSSMVSKGKRGPDRKKASPQDQQRQVKGEAPTIASADPASSYTFIDESSQIAAAVGAKKSASGSRRRKRSDTVSMSALQWSEDVREEGQQHETASCSCKAPSTPRKRVKKDCKQSPPAAAASSRKTVGTTFSQCAVSQVTASPRFLIRPFCPPALPLPHSEEPTTIARQSLSEETASTCAYPSSSFGYTMHRQHSSEALTSLTRVQPTCHRRTSSYPISSLRSSQYVHEGVERSTCITLPRLMANLPPPPGPKPAPIEPRPEHSCDGQVRWNARLCLYVGHKVDGY